MLDQKGSQGLLVGGADLDVDPGEAVRSYQLHHIRTMDRCGTDRIASALDLDLLYFHSEAPRGYVSTARYNPPVKSLGGLVNGYRIAWALGALLFMFGAWWLAVRSPAGRIFEKIEPGDVKIKSLEGQRMQEPTIEGEGGPRDIEVLGAEFVIKSADGSLVMHVWADEARKDEGRYSVREGVLQFVMDQKNTLILKVSNANFSDASGIARVSGTIVGHIVGSEQFFSAEDLTWDQSTEQVRATTVSFVGPSLEVKGERMVIELDTGEVRFDGTVTAGV
jgi:hypothetical protein